VDLRIFLIGYVALVPNFENGTLTVVLPEARGELEHAHFPMLIWACKNQMEGCDQFPAEVPHKVLEHDPDFGVLSLRGEDIGLLGGIQGDAEKIAFAGGYERRSAFLRGFIGEVPKRSNAEDFAWVASLGKVSSGEGRIHGSLLRDPTAYQVAGRLQLSGVRGRASTFGFVDVEGSIYSFVFKGSGLPSIWDDRQALADVTLVSIPLQGEAATLRLEGLPPDTSRTRELQLRRSGQDGTIDIVIGNLPPFEYEHADQERGEHFSLYYRLVSGHAHGSSQIPLRGALSVSKESIEGPCHLVPPIIDYVEGRDSCPDESQVSSDVVIFGPHAASNRAICAQAVYLE